jgi:hypothetical protein
MCHWLTRGSFPCLPIVKDGVEYKIKIHFQSLYLPPNVLHFFHFQVFVVSLWEGIVAQMSCLGFHQGKNSKEVSHPFPTHRGAGLLTGAMQAHPGSRVSLWEVRLCKRCPKGQTDLPQWVLHRVSWTPSDEPPSIVSVGLCTPTHRTESDAAISSPMVGSLHSLPPAKAAGPCGSVWLYFIWFFWSVRN